MSLLRIFHQNITHCWTVWPVGEIVFEELLITINALSCVAGIMGNLLLLVGLLKSKLTQQNTMKVIFSLGLSDMAISSLIIPLFIIIIYTKTIDCLAERVFQSVNFLFGISTGNMLLILSVDRVLLISWPRIYRRWITVKFTMTVLAASWAVAFIACVSTYFMQPFLILRALLATALSYFALSVVSYARIMLVVRKHRLRVRGQNDGLNERTNPRSNKKRTNELHIETFRPKKKLKVNKRRKKISFQQNVEFVNSPRRDTDWERKNINKPLSRNLVRDIADPGNCDVSREEMRFDIPIGQSATVVSADPDEIKQNVNSSRKKESSNSIGKTYVTAVSDSCKSWPKTQNAGSGAGNQDSDPGLVEKLAQNSGKSTEQKSPINSPVNQDSIQTNKTTFIREINVTWTVAIVIGTLFLCYIPLVCAGYVWAHQEYEVNRHTSKLRSAYAWTLTLAYLHSSFNPYIIIARSRTLRRRLKLFIPSSCKG